MLGAFPEQLRDSGARRRSSGSASRSAPTRSSTVGRRRRRDVPVGRRSASRGADRALGGRRGGVAARASRSACRSIAPAACSREPTLAVPGHPEIFVVGDICALAAGRPAAAGRGAGRDAGGRARGAQHRCAPIRGEPLEPFRYRDYGNMATIGRGSAVADIGPRQGVGVRRLADLAISSTSSG